MNKAYARINWENYPSDSTPINERNLNKIDAAVDEIDNRVITQDATKLDKTTASTLVKDIAFDESTGIFTVTHLNGATIMLDTKLERLAVNFDFDKNNQQLIILLDDGTKQYVDLSALIAEYEFSDTETIAFSVDSDGKVSAIVKDGSITEKKLQPNFLADVKVEVAKAQVSASAATTSELNAKASESNAKEYEKASKTSETNAKESENVASVSADNAAESASEAETSAANALSSANIATLKANATAVSEANAKTSEQNASGSAASASDSANVATEKALESSEYANVSKSYAIGTDGEIRENDNTDNAKYYYEQAKQISQGLNGVIPMGTVAFADLPTADMEYGWMYNISDEFVSDERFNDGGGIYYGAGNNVIWMSDDKWDVTASSGVTGVKGDQETVYRQGNVNITPANIGLGNVNNTADIDKSVKYATEAHVLRTYDANGNSHGEGNWLLRAQYARDGDDYFKIFVTDGKTKVDMATKATKLATGRTINVNLASDIASSFDGTANMTTGCYGTLPISKGGTGATTATAALNNLNGLSKAGGAMSGALNLANGVWNACGDDAYFGDGNAAGCMAFKAQGGGSMNTGIALFGASTDNMYGRLLVANDGYDMYLCTNGSFFVSNGTNTARAQIYASAFTQSSSRRVKTNIQDMTEEEAEKLLQLNPVSYDYVNENMPDGCFGLIAEDTCEIIPSCVIGDVDCADDDKDAIDSIGIDYSKLVPHLIKMVQIQEKRISDLETQIQYIPNKKGN